MIYAIVALVVMLALIAIGLVVVSSIDLGDD